MTLIPSFQAPGALVTAAGEDGALVLRNGKVIPVTVSEQLAAVAGIAVTDAQSAANAAQTSLLAVPAAVALATTAFGSQVAADRVLAKAAADASAASARISQYYALPPLQIGSVSVATGLLAAVPGINAHRGFSDLGPENTMPNFQQAARIGQRLPRGFLALETDVQVSSDGVPVLMHDDTVDRTTNGTGTVTQMTAAALRALDAGAKWNPAGLAAPPFAGAPVPFFSEYCALGAQTSLPLMPEIKNYRTAADIGLMIAVAQAAGVAAQCEWQSFQQSDLVAARSYDPTCALCLTVESLSGSAFSAYAALGGRLSIHIKYSWLQANPAIIATARGYGIPTYAWTVPSGSTARALLDLGVTRITSDAFFTGIF